MKFASMRKNFGDKEKEKESGKQKTQPGHTEEKKILVTGSAGAEKKLLVKDDSQEQATVIGQLHQKTFGDVSHDDYSLKKTDNDEENSSVDGTPVVQSMRPRASVTSIWDVDSPDTWSKKYEDFACANSCDDNKICCKEGMLSVDENEKTGKNSSCSSFIVKNIAKEVESKGTPQPLYTWGTTNPSDNSKEGQSRHKVDILRSKNVNSEAAEPIHAPTEPPQPLPLPPTQLLTLPVRPPEYRQQHPRFPTLYYAPGDQGHVPLLPMIPPPPPPLPPPPPPAYTPDYRPGFNPFWEMERQRQMQQYFMYMDYKYKMAAMVMNAEGLPRQPARQFDNIGQSAAPGLTKESSGCLLSRPNTKGNTSAGNIPRTTVSHVAASAAPAHEAKSQSTKTSTASLPASESVAAEEPSRHRQNVQSMSLPTSVPLPSRPPTEHKSAGNPAEYDKKQYKNTLLLADKSKEDISELIKWGRNQADKRQPRSVDASTVVKPSLPGPTSSSRTIDVIQEICDEGHLVTQDDSIREEENQPISNRRLKNGQQPKYLLDENSNVLSGRQSTGYVTGTGHEDEGKSKDYEEWNSSGKVSWHNNRSMPPKKIIPLMEISVNAPTSIDYKTEDSGRVIGRRNISLRNSTLPNKVSKPQESASMKRQQYTSKLTIVIPPSVAEEEEWPGETQAENSLEDGKSSWDQSDPINVIQTTKEPGCHGYQDGHAVHKPRGVHRTEGVGRTSGRGRGRGRKPNEPISSSELNELSRKVDISKQYVSPSSLEENRNVITSAEKGSATQKTGNKSSKGSEGTTCHNPTGVFKPGGVGRTSGRGRQRQDVCSKENVVVVRRHIKQLETTCPEVGATSGNVRPGPSNDERRKPKGITTRLASSKRVARDDQYSSAFSEENGIGLNSTQLQSGRSCIPPGDSVTAMVKTKTASKENVPLKTLHPIPATAESRSTTSARTEMAAVAPSTTTSTYSAPNVTTSVNCPGDVIHQPAGGVHKTRDGGGVGRVSGRGRSRTACKADVTSRPGSGAPQPTEAAPHRTRELYARPDSPSRLLTVAVAGIKGLRLEEKRDPSVERKSAEQLKSRFGAVKQMFTRR